MSEAAKKFRKTHGDFLPEFVDNPYISGFSHIVVGEYNAVRKAFKGVETLRYEFEGSFTFSIKNYKFPSTALALLKFNGQHYNAEYVDDVMPVLGSIKKMEHWQLPDDKKHNHEVHALVLIDARGDCAVIAGRHVDLNDEQDLNEVRVLGNIESMITETFDPFDF
jgi:hypothetical protein